MTIEYDGEGDILHIHYGNRLQESSCYDMIGSGIMRRMDGGKHIGFMILSYSIFREYEWVKGMIQEDGEGFEIADFPSITLGNTYSGQKKETITPYAWATIHHPPITYIFSWRRDKL